MPPPRGAMRVVSAFGIDVHVHWSWLLVAVLMVQARATAYKGDAGLAWNIAEYLMLFGIIVLHEFGHALACKSVGGRAEHVLLWPLGGVAYVRPPPRPGATLWVSAAGPLVNVVLIPISLAALAIVNNLPASSLAPEMLENLRELTGALTIINAIVLAFNCLPVYPLDGGQMLRSVLWFLVGPHQSLIAASFVGVLGSLGLVALGFAVDWWLILIGGFSLMSSWGGFRLARARAAAATLPKRITHACPACREPPPLGNCWPCPACRLIYDAFEDEATCPHCQYVAGAVPCPFCGDAFPVAAFYAYSVSDPAGPSESPPIDVG